MMVLPGPGLPRPGPVVLRSGVTAAAGRGVGMGAELNPAQRLHAATQSLWLDSINRVMLRWHGTYVSWRSRG